MRNRPYIWRQLTEEQRQELLNFRKERRKPWHAPAHRAGWFGLGSYHITAACYEHAAYIGRSPQRMDDFSRDLVALVDKHAEKLCAWCVLPNHYHALVHTRKLQNLLHELGQFHGRTSHQWNTEEQTRGRKVFYRVVDREMRSEAHFWATLNYAHNNPVRHGYVEKWQDWRWSSAAEFLEREGLAEATRLWQTFPVKDYGKGWDNPNM